MHKNHFLKKIPPHDSLYQEMKHSKKIRKFAANENPKNCCNSNLFETSIKILVSFMKLAKNSNAGSAKAKPHSHENVEGGNQWQDFT